MVRRMAFTVVTLAAVMAASGSGANGERGAGQSGVALPESGPAGRLSRSVPYSRRPGVGDGDDLAVGTDFSLAALDGSVNWRRVGSVFVTAPAWSRQLLGAGDIRGSRTLYVYYTARRKNGTAVRGRRDRREATGSLRGSWSAGVSGRGLDRRLPIRDETAAGTGLEGRWQQPQAPDPPAQPLSDDGTTLMGEKQEILRNEVAWEAHLIEGPFILRRGGWFYLFYSADACCGRRCDYKLGVARARKLLGPWERHAANPILSANDDWKCPGHGSIVTDARGRTFLLYHAYNPTDFEYVGRQGLLDEVTWDAQGWPAINGGRGPSRSAHAPVGRVRQASRRQSRMSSTRASWTRLACSWDQVERPAAEVRGAGSASRRGAPPRGRSPSRQRPRRQPHRQLRWWTSARLRLVRAPVCGFGNRGQHAGHIGRAARESAGTPDPPATVVMWQVQKLTANCWRPSGSTPGDRVHLQLKATARSRFDFAVSADGRRWKTVGTQAEGATAWTAVRVALVVAGDRVSARFGAFTLTEGS
jgi:hypothetical protein